jgi:hypothetical protein
MSGRCRCRRYVARISRIIFVTLCQAAKESSSRTTNSSRIAWKASDPLSDDDDNSDDDSKPSSSATTTTTTTTATTTNSGNSSGGGSRSSSTNHTKANSVAAGGKRSEGDTQPKSGATIEDDDDSDDSNRGPQRAVVQVPRYAQRPKLVSSRRGVAVPPESAAQPSKPVKKKRSPTSSPPIEAGETAAVRWCYACRAGAGVSSATPPKH